MKRLNVASMLVAALTGGLASAAHALSAPRPTNHAKPKRRGASRSYGGGRKKTTYFPPGMRNGERECARRRRQIVTGHVQVSA